MYSCLGMNILNTLLELDEFNNQIADFLFS